MHYIFNRLKAFLAGLKTSWRAHAVLASVEGEYFISILSNDFFLILPVVFLRFKYFHCMKKLKTYWLFLCTPTFAPAEGKHSKEHNCRYNIICKCIPSLAQDKTEKNKTNNILFVLLYYKIDFKFYFSSFSSSFDNILSPSLVSSTMLSMIK